MNQQPRIVQFGPEGAGNSTLNLTGPTREFIGPSALSIAHDDRLLRDLPPLPADPPSTDSTRSTNAPSSIAYGLEHHFEHDRFAPVKLTTDGEAAPPMRWLGESVDALGLTAADLRPPKTPASSTPNSTQALLARLQALKSEEEQLLGATPAAGGSSDFPENFFSTQDEAGRTTRRADDETPSASTSREQSFTPSVVSTRGVRGEAAVLDETREKIGQIGVKFPQAASLFDRLARLQREEETLLRPTSDLER